MLSRGLNAVINASPWTVWGFCRLSFRKHLYDIETGQTLFSFIAQIFKPIESVNCLLGVITQMRKMWRQGWASCQFKTNKSDSIQLTSWGIGVNVWKIILHWTCVLHCVVPVDCSLKAKRCSMSCFHGDSLATLKNAFPSTCESLGCVWSTQNLSDLYWQP